MVLKAAFLSKTPSPQYPFHHASMVRDSMLPKTGESNNRFVVHTGTFRCCLLELFFSLHKSSNTSRVPGKHALPFVAGLHVVLQQR